jgi:hypothetical protein
LKSEKNEASKEGRPGSCGKGKDGKGRKKNGSRFYSFEIKMPNANTVRRSQVVKGM